MLKKIGLILLIVVLFATGCGKTDKSSVINDFKKSVDKAKSYVLNGTMEIINDEDVFKYTIETKYLYDDSDYYKITLVNQTNNHEQIILKNNEGVYVQTQKSTKQNII